MMSPQRTSDFFTPAAPLGATQENGAFKQAGDEWCSGGIHGRAPIAGSSHQLKGEVSCGNADIPAPPRAASPAGNLFSRRRFAVSILGLAALVAAPCTARAEPGVMSAARDDDEPTVARSGRASVLPHLARRYVGMTGPRLGLPSRLWCADFSSMIRRKAGLRAPSSRRAIDQVQYTRRISRPVPGALLITSRGRRGGHVDIIISVLPDGRVLTIGGNVGRVVAERIRSPRGILVLPT